MRHNTGPPNNSFKPEPLRDPAGARLMGEVMRICVFAAAALALSSGAVASEASQPEAFTALFASTCMKHFYSQDELRAEMSAERADVLRGEPSSFFLGGKSGTAWSVLIAGGKYVVALRDDSVCAVFAQRAPVAEVQTNFVSLVATAPEPLVASPRDATGPNSGALKTIAYSWYRPEDKTELLFTLTTSSEAAPVVQAMASLAMANKPDNSLEAKPPHGSP